MTKANSSEIAVKKGELKITDFADYTAENLNVTVGEKVVGVGYDFIIKKGLNINPTKIYKVGEEIYFYASDKVVYGLNNGEINPVINMNFDNPPELFEILFRGKKALAVCSDGEGAIVQNGYAVVPFPKGEGYTVHNGVLCCYSGCELIFGGAYDYAENAVNVTESGFICLDGIGDILALYSDGKKLVALGEKGGYNIYLDGERLNTKVERIDVAFNELDGRSVKNLQGVSYMVMQGKLYSFDGNLKKTTSALDKKDYSVTGEAFVLDGKYALPVNGGEDLLFIYDTVSKESYFVPYAKKIFCDGGYFVDLVMKTFGKILKSQTPECEWRSVTTDFGVDVEKTLYMLSVKSNGGLTIRIIGDHGEKIITAEGGNFKTRLNFLSKEFTFKISGLKGRFPLESLKLYYRK